MTNAEKIIAIYAVAKKNGVKVHKNFNPEYFVQNSFEAIGEDLGTAILDNMWEKCRYGVNNGLTKVAGDIGSLSEIAVELTSVKAKNSDFVSRRKHAADKLMATPLPGKNTPDMLKPVNEYITNTLEYIDTELAAQPENKYLTDAKAKFETLIEMSAGVVDTSSTAAKGIAESIMAGVENWRRQAASRSLSLVATNSLNALVADMKKWCERVDEVGSRQNRQAALRDVPAIPRDPLFDVMKVVEATDLYDVFVTRVAEAKTEMDELNAELKEAQEQWQSEKKELKANIDELKNEQNECVVRAQNGEDYNQNCAKYEELEAQIAELTEQYEDNVEPDYFADVQDRIKVRKQLHDTINGLATRLKFERRAEYFPALITNHCHIPELLALLNGTIDENIRTTAKQTIEAVNIVIRQLSNKDSAFINQLNKEQRELERNNTRVQIEKKVKTPAQTVAAGENRSPIANKFASLVANGNTNPVTQQQQTGPNPIVNRPISGEDK